MRPTGFRKLVLVLVLGCSSTVKVPAAAPPSARTPATPRASAAPGPPSPTSTPTVAPLPSLPAVALAEVPEADSVTLEAHAENGGWLVVCHPTGPRPAPELVLGERGSEPIDDLLGWDATGRWLVVRRTGHPFLVDVVTDARVDLGELGFDDRDDALDKRQHRALAFDPRGELLAYVRRRGRSELVLRTLATGDEQTVQGLPGEPWRLAWDASGETLVVSSIVDDTTRNGTLDFPVRLRKAPRLACSGLLPRFRVAQEVGDRPVSVLVSRDGTSVTRADDFAVPFGHGFIARGSDGALTLVRGALRQPLADAECLGRILVADPSRELALVSCTNDRPPPTPNGTKRPKRVGVELVGVGYRQELGVVVQPMALDRWPEAAPARLVALYPGSDTLLVDLDTRRALGLRPGDRVLGTSGTRALVHRERSLVAFDAARGTETPLVSNVEPFAGLVSSGTLVAVGSVLLDTASGSVGKLPGRPLALTPRGDALIAEGGVASADIHAHGPLRWHHAAAAK